MADTVVQTLELIVDLFLQDDPSLEEEEVFRAEGCVEEEHDAGGNEDFNQTDRQLFAQNMGRTYRQFGDEFEEKFRREKSHSVTDEIKDLFSEAQESDIWPRFAEIMDSAMASTGIDDAGKMLGAVLVSVKGLQYLGGALKNCTLRYIREKNLDKTLKKLDEKNQSQTYPLLD